MQYYVKVLSINENNEYEITLDFGKKILTCFIEYLGSDVKEGEFRLVELNPFFLDDIKINPLKKDNYLINRIGESYEYNLNGFLIRDILFLGDICIQDDDFLSFSMYDCTFISLIVDRLGVSFID